MTDLRRSCFVYARAWRLARPVPTVTRPCQREAAPWFADQVCSHESKQPSASSTGSNKRSGVVRGFRRCRQGCRTEQEHVCSSNREGEPSSIIGFSARQIVTGIRGRFFLMIGQNPRAGWGAARTEESVAITAESVRLRGRSSVISAQDG